MTTIAFDTLEYANRLKAGGFSEMQAEAQAKALASVIDQSLATKSDIKRLEHTLKDVEDRITSNLTIRFGGMLVAAVTVLAILIKIL